MRVNYFQLVSEEVNQLTAIETMMTSYSISQQLLELVKLRVSQINHCAFCVSMHTQQLRLFDETDQRIDLMSVWEEAPCYSERERAAFRWAEALTKIADGAGVSDELYEATAREFGDEGISQLSIAVAMINTWNRLAVPFQTDHRHIKSFLKKPTVST